MGKKLSRWRRAKSEMAGSCWSQLSWPVVRKELGGQDGRIQRHLEWREGGQRYNKQIKMVRADREGGTMGEKSKSDLKRKEKAAR